MTIIDVEKSIECQLNKTCTHIKKKQVKHRPYIITYCSTKRKPETKNN